MRRVLIAIMTVSFLLLAASQAEALCMTSPLDGVIKQSDSLGGVESRDGRGPYYRRVHTQDPLRKEGLCQNRACTRGSEA